MFHRSNSVCYQKQELIDNRKKERIKMLPAKSAQWDRPFQKSCNKDKTLGSCFLTFLFLSLNIILKIPNRAAQYADLARARCNIAKKSHLCPRPGMVKMLKSAMPVNHHPISKKRF